MAADNGDSLAPISQWAYPFPLKNAAGTVDPDAYLAALQGSDGPFPLGLNGLWHGGIHLDQMSASPTATDSAMNRSGEVRCIADGVVVAYRLDSDYQHLSYPDKSTALYSRSFTLVKHKLTLPAAPTNTPNAPSTPNSPNNAPHPPTTAPANNDANTLSTDPADSLVFFSLYMHLAPCSVYKHSEQDKNKTWPSYYNAQPLYTVNRQRAIDQQDNVSTGEPVTGSHVHRDNHGHAGQNIGILPSGSKVKIQRPAHAPKNWGRIASIVSGDIAPLTPGNAVPADASHGWVFLPWLDSEIDPEAIDTIHVLPKPIRIGAGEVIGYLGEYQNVEHASTLPPSPQRALLHVEVFAGDNLQAFLARSRTRAAQLTREPKTQLVLSKGANLYSYKTDGDLTLPANTTVTLATNAPQTGMWTKVQTRASGTASTTNYWIARSELASQIACFRDAHPAEYQRYFSNCGWTVTGSGQDAALGYAHPTFTNGARVIGDELFNALRRDCSIDTFGKPVQCPPVASMAHVVSSPLYQELQVKDFVDRLNQAIGKSPSGYAYQIKDYLQSPLGRATVLDQDVNWPRATPVSMKTSLDRFFQHNPQVPRNPAEWGANRSAYEPSILQDYGPSRSMAQVNGVSVAPVRYQHLVQALGMPS